MHVRRGDIVIVDLDPMEGSEQRGLRPSLVVQNDVGNENAPTTIVAPFTSPVGDELYPFEALVQAGESPLEDDSVVLCNQLRTVSIEGRVRDNLGSIPPARMEEVDAALEISLGLRGP